MTIVLPLEDLEQLCNLPKRTHTQRPSFDACLGQTLVYDNSLKTVVRLEYKFEPGKVRAHLR